MWSGWGDSNSWPPAPKAGNGDIGVCRFVSGCSDLAGATVRHWADRPTQPSAPRIDTSVIHRRSNLDSRLKVECRFSEFVDRVDREHERVVVTRNGRPHHWGIDRETATRREGASQRTRRHSQRSPWHVSRALSHRRKRPRGDRPTDRPSKRRVSDSLSGADH